MIDEKLQEVLMDIQYQEDLKKGIFDIPHKEVCLQEEFWKGNPTDKVKINMLSCPCPKCSPRY